jgi:hypothetical protein
VAVELNAVPLEAFFNCFKDTCIKAGGNNTWTEIKYFLIFFYFCFLFHTNPGTLLSDYALLVYKFIFQNITQSGTPEITESTF